MELGCVEGVSRLRPWLDGLCASLSLCGRRGVAGVPNWEASLPPQFRAPITRVSGLDRVRTREGYPRGTYFKDRPVWRAAGVSLGFPLKSLGRLPPSGLSFSPGGCLPGSGQMSSSLPFPFVRDVFCYVALYVPLRYSDRSLGVRTVLGVTLDASASSALGLLHAGRGP